MDLGVGFSPPLVHSGRYEDSHWDFHFLSVWDQKKLSMWQQSRAQFPNWTGFWQENAVGIHAVAIRPSKHVRNGKRFVKIQQHSANVNFWHFWWKATRSWPFLGLTKIPKGRLFWGSLGPPRDQPYPPSYHCIISQFPFSARDSEREWVRDPLPAAA